MDGRGAEKRQNMSKKQRGTLNGVHFSPYWQRLPAAVRATLARFLRLGRGTLVVAPPPLLHRKQAFALGQRGRNVDAVGVLVRGAGRELVWVGLGVADGEPAALLKGLASTFSLGEGFSRGVDALLDALPSLDRSGATHVRALRLVDGPEWSGGRALRLGRRPRRPGAQQQGRLSSGRRRGQRNRSELALSTQGGEGSCDGRQGGRSGARSQVGAHL